LRLANKEEKVVATSSNPKIQKLMDEVENIDLRDSNLEEKLRLIAQKVAREQQKMKGKDSTVVRSQVNDAGLVDPSDAFACEGCQ
jgi:uncharacterized protein YoxC